MQGKCQGFDIPKPVWQCNVKHNRLPWVIAGNCWTKSQSLLFPGAGEGGGAVVTNDWCITSDFQSIQLCHFIINIDSLFG